MSAYLATYQALRARLAEHSLEKLVERSGAQRLGDDRIGLRCVGHDYQILYPAGTVLQSDDSPADVNVSILLLLHLMEATGREQAGRWISFEQLPGGAGYLAAFRGRVVQPILRAFGRCPERLAEAALGLGGEPLDLGDVAMRIPALPRVPIAFIVWRGDDEFSPSVSVVFDASVEGYLDSEVLTVLAELTSRRLVAAEVASKEG
jgi:hypothetical protein